MAFAIENLPVPIRVDAHGMMRVGETRVRLDTVIFAWKQGDSPEQIVENFEVLSLADVYAIIGYYLNHRLEVEKYLEQNELKGDQLRQKHEQRFPQAAIRERLLARRSKMSEKDA